ncbi:MAG: hypothetical protein Q7S83_03705 [bacterium]|nr:hypothetical protein [bacterium]
MKALLVAHDVAPSQILEMLATNMEKSGRHLCRRCLAFGVAPDHPLGLEEFKEVDFVLIGMSSSAVLAKQEIFAAKNAAERGIPLGFVSDLFGCYKRPWLAEYRKHTKFVFLPVAQEVRGAKFLFPNAEVIFSGNPCWEKYFEPANPVEDTRGALGFGIDDKVIMCSGGKGLVLNMLLYGGVIEAAHLLDKRSQEGWRVVINLHPGDRSDPELYSGFVTHSKVPVRIVRAPEFSAHNLIAASDLLVAPASNTGIEAACMRKPVINYFTELYFNEMESYDGMRIWPPCQMGISSQVSSNPSSLANKIFALLVHGGYKQEMLIRQMNVFPVVANPGEAIKKICQAIDSLEGQ